MRVVCIVQARMGSKRLPGKVLLPLNGHTVIGEVLTRCRRIPGVDQVVCAIPPDAPLLQEAARYCKVVVGHDEDNVLARYQRAAKVSNADVVIRVTGDCPLICPELCGEVWRKLVEEEADYSSNVEPRTFPQGLDCEAFTVATLNASSKPDEHVTTWMRSSPDVKRVHVVSQWKIEGRLTLDTEDDYRAICAYFGHEPYMRAAA